MIFSQLYPVAERHSKTFSRRFLPDGDGNHRPSEHLFALFEVEMEMVRVAACISCPNVSHHHAFKELLLALRLVDQGLQQ